MVHLNHIDDDHVAEGQCMRASIDIMHRTRGEAQRGDLSLL